MSFNTVLTQILTWVWAQRMLHERNWRESLHVQEISSSTKFSLNSCSLSGISEFITGLSVLSVVLFCLFFFFKKKNLISISGLPDISSTAVDTVTGEMSLSIRSSQFSSLSITYCRWRRRAWRRCWAMTPLSRKCPWSWWIKSWRRICWQAWKHDRNEVLRDALYLNTVFNEMWFLTIDPFIRISVFIAKLSKRQYCWRILEDFHGQEYVQFFDINKWPLHASALLHWRVRLS